MHEQTMKNKEHIDWVEIITDSYLDPHGLEELNRLRGEFVIVPHGLEMSIGADSPLDQEYLEAVAQVADHIDAPWVSDHLCFTREGDLRLLSLNPIIRTREKAKAVAAKARAVQDRLSRPFLLENITYYVDPPSGLSETQFLTEVLERSDCGLLLDLNNLALNAINHSFDPLEFLADIPLERVVQVHLAGNAPQARAGKLVLDGHDAAVGDEVFELLRVLVSQNAPCGVLIERDDHFPDDFQEIINDLTRARAVLSGAPS